MSDEPRPSTGGTDPSSLRRWGGFCLGLAISALFIYLTLHRVDLGAVADEIRRASLPILALALVPKFLGFVCMTLRSTVLFRHLHRYGFWRMFKSVLVAFVGNNVLPFRAGELLRVGYLTHEHDEVEPSSALAAIALERLLDMLTLAILFLTLVFFALIDLSSEGVPQMAVVYVTTALLAAALLGVMLVSRRPEVFTRLVGTLTSVFGERISSFLTDQAEAFADGVAGLASLRQTVAVVVLSFLYWSTAVVAIGIWGWAFGLDLPWHAPMAIAVFSAFATVLPSSPGFVGTYHYFVKTAVMFFGVGAATAASFALVGHFVAMVPFTVVGVLVLFRDYLHGRLVMPGESPPPATSHSDARSSSVDR